MKTEPVSRSRGVKYSFAMLLMFSSCMLVGCDSPVAVTSLEEALLMESFSVQGEYRNSDGEVKQIIALRHHLFEEVHYPKGFPYITDEHQADELQSVTRRRWNSLETDWQEVLNGYEKFQRSSPTFNAAPPADAIVLFDGSEETFNRHWQADARMSAEGHLLAGATSIQTFEAFTLHIEFCVPYMPTAHKQARGNSGCYLQGRYEIQILDSFGRSSSNQECGAIYRIASPEVMMSYPPLSWQTYDVHFRPAQFDNQQKKISDAQVTVIHNGVVIHRDLKLPHGTRGGPLKKEGSSAGPIFLQDHASPVQFRHIWIIPEEG